ncbi:uncharacterized protein OCT59_014795 [Rhizophagus irregularis]|uniref:uncharacterized protein n=1 Tax=Rhizophagus irregularis TaxID=588596 RepID=UPI000CB5F39B|nr:hypothetical protein OCT59_014795 [Rhizophagus irregularis]
MKHMILSNCRGKRPEIVKNTPKCFIKLMKKCWDSSPSNRLTIIMLENNISKWIRCIYEYYEMNRDGNYFYEEPNIDSQLKNGMLEFVKANNTLVQNKQIILYRLIHKNYYINCKLTEILVQEEPQGFDCRIED